MSETSQQQPGVGKMMKQMRDIVGGDVNMVFRKLKSSGLADHFQSWVGMGENRPVTADQITEALGEEHIAKIAGRAGVNPQQMAHSIATKLPAMVDKMTPDGKLPDPEVLSGAAGKPFAGAPQAKVRQDSKPAM